MVSVSSQSSIWWLKSPIANIRNKFTELNRTRQIIVLVVLTLLASFSIGAIIFISIRIFLSLRTSDPHKNTEYVRLENLDDDAISNGHEPTETTIPLTHP